MHSTRRMPRFAAGLLILVLLTFFGQAAAQARPLNDWSTPQWIPGLEHTSSNQYPIFVTDTTGKVHVVHSQWMSNGTFTIVYSQWSVGVGWSQPVDVLIPPGGQARVLGAFLDGENLNVLFMGGIDPNWDMYFFQSPLASAGKASSWSEPKLIGPNAIIPTTGTIVNIGGGKYLTIYSSNENGTGLYSLYTDDSGETWTRPQPFYFTGSDTLWASDMQVSLSSDRRVHAVWALGDVTGNSRQVTYAAFDPAENNWSNPIVLDRAVGYEADTPAIIEHDGALMVIYHNSFPTTRWMKRSLDGGKTWTTPTRLFNHVGSNGAAALVIDSSNTLHMFFGNRVGPPTVHGVWHSTWMGTTWSVPAAVVSGPLVDQGVNGEEGFDPSYLQALIIQGNMALVVWRHDPAVGPIHIWYSYNNLGTPQLTTTQVLAAGDPTAEAAETIVAAGSGLASTATPTPKPVFADDFPEDTGAASMRSVLTIAIGSTLVLVLVIIILKRRQQ